MPNITSANWSSAYKLCVAATNSKKTTRSLISRWKHMERYKGTEWLVNRLKNLLNIAKLHLDDRIDDARELSLESSIAITPTGYPKGHEGRIVQNIVLGNRATKKRNILVLRLYTGLKLKETSKSQFKKAIDSITSGPDVDPAKKLDHTSWLAKYGGAIRQEWIKEKVVLQLPTLDKLKGFSRYPRLTIKTEGDPLPYQHMVESLLSKGLVPQSLLDCYDEKGFYTQAYAQGNQSIAGDESLGDIIMLQEGGAKGRVICSPNAWIQFYMYPLHQYLAKMVKVEEAHETPFYGISCVINQPKGIYSAMLQKASDGYAASVDLSAATDRFPLWLQTSFLSAIGLTSFAKAFSDLRGPYNGLDGNPWFYETGQPMGIYSSFPLFHLTHLFLLRKLSIDLDLDPRKVNFAVLGDDVLFFDERLHDLYRRAMTKLGVNISEHKSFNKKLVEFAGCIIPESMTAFRPYKWAVDLEFGPIVNLLDALGKRADNLGRWFQSSRDLYSRTVGQRDVVLNPLVSTAEPKTGINQYMTKSYLRQRFDEAEGKSSSDVIMSLIPPGLTVNNNANLEKDIARFLPEEPELMVKPFDPYLYMDPPEWEGHNVTFSRDPLIKAIASSDANDAK